MARPPQDPFKLIDTGREAPLLFSMLPGETARVYHWACLHCGPGTPGTAPSSAPTGKPAPTGSASTWSR